MAKGISSESSRSFSASGYGTQATPGGGQNINVKIEPIQLRAAGADLVAVTRQRECCVDRTR